MLKRVQYSCSLTLKTCALYGSALSFYCLTSCVWLAAPPRWRMSHMPSPHNGQVGRPAHAQRMLSVSYPALCSSHAASAARQESGQQSWAVGAGRQCCHWSQMQRLLLHHWQRTQPLRVAALSCSSAARQSIAGTSNKAPAHTGPSRSLR